MADNPARKRPKLTTACTECRRRKTRCDGGKPCGNCFKTRSNCQYIQQYSERSAAPAIQKTLPEQIEERLRTIETLLTRLVRAIPDDGRWIDGLEPRYYPAPAHSRQLSGREAWRGGGPSLPSVSGIPRGRAEGSEDREGLVRQPLPLILPAARLPPPEAQDHLLASFIDYGQTLAPMCDIASLTQDAGRLQSWTAHYGATLSASAPFPPMSQLLYFSVLAVGSLSTPHPARYCNDPQYPTLETCGAFYFQEAHSLLQYYTETPRSSTVMAMILLARYCQCLGTTDLLKNSLILSGLACRMALELTLPTPIFWSLYVLDRSNAIAFGTPILDLPWPESSRYEEERLRSTHVMSDFMWMVRLFQNVEPIIRAFAQHRLRLPIDRSHRRPSSPSAGAYRIPCVDTHSVDKALSSWLSSLPTHLSFSHPPKEQPARFTIPTLSRDVNSPKQYKQQGFALTLELLYAALIIFIHRPHVVQAFLQAPSGQYVADVNAVHWPLCVRAALAIDHALDRVRDSTGQVYVPGWHYNIAMQCPIEFAIYSSLKVWITALVDDRVTGALRQAVERLFRRGLDMLQLCGSWMQVAQPRVSQIVATTVEALETFETWQLRSASEVNLVLALSDLIISSDPMPLSELFPISSPLSTTSEQIPNREPSTTRSLPLEEQVSCSPIDTHTIPRACTASLPGPGPGPSPFVEPARRSFDFVPIDVDAQGHVSESRQRATKYVHYTATQSGPQFAGTSALEQRRARSMITLPPLAPMVLDAISYTHQAEQEALSTGFLWDL